MSQSAQGKSKQRDPPPALFLHPSPAASHVSLPVAPGVPGPTSATAPGATPHFRPEAGPPSSSPAEPRRPVGRSPGLGAGFGVPGQLRQDSTRVTDRTDALWAEMQATLEEVELSASGGTRVFGPDHEQRLAELRQAQIALAQAWARSEADEAIGTTLSTSEGDSRTAKAAAPGTKEGASAGAAADAGGKADGGSTGGTSARPASSGVGAERLGAKMEQETAQDILLAKKRREANDRYFQRVNRGVLDVVAKLEDVSKAMKSVEQESKDIWQHESAPSTARSQEG